MADDKKKKSTGFDGAKHIETRIQQKKVAQKKVAQKKVAQKK